MHSSSSNLQGFLILLEYNRKVPGHAFFRYNNKTNKITKTRNDVNKSEINDYYYYYYYYYIYIRFVEFKNFWHLRLFIITSFYF